MSKTIDMVGTRYGKLIGVSRSDKVDVNKCAYWNFTCDCGNTTVAAGKNVRNGLIVSCGCYNKDRIKHQTYGKEHPNWNGIGEIHGARLARIRTSAERRNLPYEVSDEFIWNLFIRQDRKCALSGLPLTFGRSRATRNSGTTASLDRIDSYIGYIPSNVQWVHKNINIMKQSMTDEEFIDMCTLVSNHKNKGNI